MVHKGVSLDKPSRHGGEVIHPRDSDHRISTSKEPGNPNLLRHKCDLSTAAQVVFIKQKLCSPIYAADNSHFHSYQ